MKTLVVYYSLSGTTRTVARAIAKEFDAYVDEIRCARYQPGFWGFLRAGYDSWRDRLPAIEDLKHAASAYDLILDPQTRHCARCRCWPPEHQFPRLSCATRT